MDEIYNNLLNTFLAATPDEREAGMHWYSDARSTIRALSDEVGGSPMRFAAVVAALSPRIRWATNLDAATRVMRSAAMGLEEPKVAGFGHNRAIAWALANGASIDILTGPKTKAFFWNLVGNEQEVTVDVWMLRAAGLEVANKGNIENVQQAIKRIARHRRLTPAQVQAIIWITVRDRWNNDI